MAGFVGCFERLPRDESGVHSVDDDGVVEGSVTLEVYLGEGGVRKQFG